MTKITYIPGEIANAAIDKHGNRKPVTRTHHIFDDTKGKSQAEVNKEFGNAIGGLNSQNYVTVDSFNALPDTGEADTVYRVSNWDGTQQDPTVYSEYAWDGEDYVHLSTKTQIGEVFDISAYHATGGTLAKYADLAEALGTNGANVPPTLRKGGMSVKFVQSSDNKYVQYRLMADTFSTTEADWQGVIDEPVYGSSDLISSDGLFKSLTKITPTYINDFPIYGYLEYENEGEVHPISSWKTSSYLEVKDGDAVEFYLFKYSTTNAIVFYNSQKEMLSMINTYTSLTKQVIIVPAGAKYVRVSGELAHTLNQYVRIIDYSQIPDTVATQNSNNPITSGGVFSSIRNVESKYSFVTFKGVDFPTNGYYLSATAGGELAANVNYKTSDYIEVDESKKIEFLLYQINAQVAIVYYDSSKTIISYDNSYSSFVKTLLDVPSGASFVRVSAELGHFGDREQYAKVIDSSAIPQAPITLTPFINSTKIYTVCNDIGSSLETSINSRNYSSRVYLDHFYRGLNTRPNIKIDGKTNFTPFYSIYEIGYMTKYINSNTNGQTLDLSTRTENVKVVGDRENVEEVNLNINHISTRNLATENKHVRLLCIGDSVTAGANASVNKPYANAPETYWEWVQALFKMDNLENNGGFDCVTIGNQITLPNDIYGGSWVTYGKKTFDINFNGLVQNNIDACAVARAGAKVEWYLQEDNANIFWDSSANKVSIQSWINKYRTLIVNNDGSTTRCDSTNKGSAVTDVNAYNVCEPTHVLLAFGYNQTYGSEGEVRTKYLEDLDTIISIIREEFPNAYILLHLPDTAGTYFPELFKNYLQVSNDIYSMDYTKGIAKTIHDSLCYMNKDLMDLEDATNRIYYVPSYFVSPLCYGAGSRIVNDIAHLSNTFDITKQFVEGGTNGPQLHPNNTAHACWAYQIYSLIKYTLLL